jgi:hypothetical protein
MEPAVQAAVRARFRGTPPPRAADSAEAHIVSDVICEDALGDEPCRSIIKISPVPPARAGKQSDHVAITIHHCGKEEGEILLPVMAG